MGIDDHPTEIADMGTLKALAHPRRQQVLQELSLHGPATSAMLARSLGLNTGATSYHLRELAKFGFIEEESREGNVRERWWRLVRRDLRIPPRSEQSAEMKPVVDELNRLAYSSDLQSFARLQRDSDSDDEWSDAFPYSRGTIHVTRDELASFFEEYIDLLNRYKRPFDDMPVDARTIQTRFLAFPGDPPESASGTTHPKDLS